MSLHKGGFTYGMLSLWNGGEEDDDVVGWTFSLPEDCLIRSRKPSRGRIFFDWFYWMDVFSSHLHGLIVLFVQQGGFSG